MLKWGRWLNSDGKIYICTLPESCEMTFSDKEVKVQPLSFIK